MKKKFKKFMKEHHAWKSFKKEFGKRNYYGGLKQFLKENYHDGQLSGAFTWEGSKRGHNFWEKLNDEWKDFLRNNL